MVDARRKASVLQGPWKSVDGWRTPHPDERAGRLDSDESSSAVLSMGDTDFGPRGARHLFSRPPLQLNLPIPGVPTLGQIARNRGLRPKPPRRGISPRQPAAIARYLETAAIDLWGIEPERLLQDPDWYEEPHSNQGGPDVDQTIY